MTISLEPDIIEKNLALILEAVFLFVEKRAVRACGEPNAGRGRALCVG